MEKRNPELIIYINGYEELNLILTVYYYIAYT